MSLRSNGSSPVPAAGAPVGRPRSGDRVRPGDTAREEILDAAAELFTRRGYAATSTRMIAEAVGIRQASLYYHFGSKEDLLGELLVETVRPSLAFASGLDRPDDDGSGTGISGIGISRTGTSGTGISVAATHTPPAEAKLFSLAAYDTTVLCGGRWNLGALYLLPEIRGERFAGFRAERAQLRACYTRLIEQSAAPGLPLEGLTDLVFGLVESVITIRSERTIEDVEAIAGQVAAGCLRLVGVPGARIAELQIAN